MALLQGTNSYFILGDQSSWEGRASAAIEKVYEFISAELTPQNEVYRPERNKGYAGQSKPIAGISGVSGSVQMHLGDTHLGTILKWLTGDTSVTSTALDDKEMIAAGTKVTVGTSQKPGDKKQPKALVDAPVECGKIKVTLTGASGAGRLEIRGLDQLDREIRETVSFSTPGDHTSTKYFREVTSITLLDVTGTVTWKVEAVPSTYKHELALQDGIPPFKTMEVVYGGDFPITFTGLVPQSAQFGFGNVIELTLELLGRRAHIGENLKGDAGTKTDVSKWSSARPQGDVMVDLGMILEVDGKDYFCSSIDFGINQNLGYAETKYGKRQSYEREPVRQGSRELTASFTVDYDNSSELDIKSFGEDLDVKLTYATAPLGGKHTSIELHAPRCAFSEPAVPGIPDGGPIYQTVNLLPYGTGPGNELALTIHNSESGKNFI